MIYRLAEARISDLLTRFPAVAVLGPRQVGKTTLARRLVEELGAAAVYLDLELPSHRAKLSDPELYFSSQEDRLVVLDEIQRVPGLFEVLRGVIDERRRQGRRHRQFLLLGSASIDLLQQSSETLAGRIAYSELTPLLVEEVAAKKRGTGTGFGCGAVFPTAFWRQTRPRASSGARSLSALILNGTFPSWVREFPRKRCAASGPCSPTSRARC